MPSDQPPAAAAPTSPAADDPRPVVLVLVGLPASGKTTAARRWVAADPAARVRFSNDDVRAMLGHPLAADAGWRAVPRAVEGLLREVRDATVRAAVSRGLSVVVDNLNIAPRHARRLAEVVGEDARVVIDDSFLAVDVEECIRRDAARAATVGAAAIRALERTLRERGEVLGPQRAAVG